MARIGGRLRWTTGERQDRFTAGPWEVGKADFNREIGEFGEKLSVRQTVCNPVWLSLPVLPGLPVRKTDPVRPVHGTAYAARGRHIRRQNTQGRNPQTEPTAK
jgi:hypothetical protein